MDYKYNPFAQTEKAFTLDGHAGLGFLGSTTAETRQEAAKRQAEGQLMEQPISLPPHLYIPENAQGLDLRRVRSIDPGGNEILWSFTAPVGSTTRFISYGIFNDGLVEDDYSFVPLVDGIRVFPYHGNPMKNYLISLGLAPDLSESSLIKCQLTLNPGQTISWRVVNNSAVATAMGVRMVGYVDLTQRRITRRFGG